MKLHLGCGPLALPGWINIDNQPYPGVDRVLDVSEGLPFEDVRFIFAEHFIEHLPFDAATSLMRECRRVLRDDGVLRLSTPNLDWVWASHYKKVMTSEEAVLSCFAINRAFRGWGHQFLYNLQTLTALLQNAGFATVTPLTHGVSSNPDLHGLEHHEKYPDSPEVPHVVVVEASGVRAIPPVAEGAELIAEYERDVNVV
jgi:predicted SAM-dependent methyltransferase